MQGLLILGTCYVFAVIGQCENDADITASLVVLRKHEYKDITNKETKVKKTGKDLRGFESK